MTTILVVDDSAMDRRLIGGLLKRGGLSVIYAENGRQALDLLEGSPPDLVATDLQMPELDGLELVEAIRQRFPAIPVLLMTAHGSEEIAVKALQKGAASYVPKRKASRDLVGTIENILAARQTERKGPHALDWMVESESVFVLDNDIAKVPPLVSHLEAELCRMKRIDETALIQVGVALGEAIVNAVIHGNLEVPSILREDTGNAYHDLIAQRRTEQPYCARRVRVRARETRAEVTYVVTDEGPGFDPSTLPDPTDALQLEKVSGRGLLLIRTFMDEVRHNDRGNEITMVKRFDAIDGQA